MTRASLSRIAAAFPACIVASIMLVSTGAAAASRDDETNRFALGNSIWILYHEIGHLLVNEFQLPVLGREEDAVDHLATVTLLEGADEQMDNYLADAVDGFFLSARIKRNNNSDRMFFAGHGLDEQRAYEVACLMLGNDERAFTPLADSINLPVQDRERCPNAYQLARSSWLSVMEGHTGGWLSKPAKDAVLFEYGAASAKHAEAKSILENAEVLEAAAEYLSGQYVFPRQVMIRTEECGDSNAYFEPNSGEVVLCYELVEEFRTLLTGYYKDR